MMNGCSRRSSTGCDGHSKRFSCFLSVFFIYAMQLLSLLCASGFVCPSHTCQVYPRRHLCPRQRFQALGGLVTPWWDTGIVLTIKRRAKVLVKEAVPSQHFPPAVVALSLHVVCHAVPSLGIEHHQPSRDPTAGQNSFLH